MTIKWASSRIRINGSELHYRRTGGDLPQILLLHGITDNSLYWTLTMEALQADYDLIVPDSRGHGLSEATETGYHQDDLAADAAALIQALALDQPVVIGHSMGASVTAVLAATCPELVRAVILEDPPWNQQIPSAEQLQAQRDEWVHGTTVNKQTPLDVIVASKQEESPDWDERIVMAWAQAKQQVSPAVFEYMEPAIFDWASIVGRLQCPGLLLTGEPELGALVTADLATQVVDRWPEGQTVHVSGAGHSIRRDQFAAYMAAVRAFLAGLA